MTEFYDKPLLYAKENGELDKWRDSFHETERCAKAIKDLVAENHDGMYLHTDKIIEGAVGEFGTERVTLALAATIQHKDWDGRFSQSNKEWANSINVPQDNHYNMIDVGAHSTLLNGVVGNYRKYLITLEKNPAEKSVEHLQGGTAMAEHKTTFEVSSMTKLENGGNVKALANVVMNGEIAVNGVKVMSGEKGLFVAMPSKKIGGEFVDIAHPVTDTSYAQISEAVLSSYDKLVSSRERTLKNELATDKTKPVTSKIDVSLHSVSNAKSILAAGQISIDECFVIKDVKVVKTEGKPEFVAMPSYQNQNGKYVDYANPITTAMNKSLNEAVINKFKALEQVAYRGVKYAELGDKSEIASLPKQNNKYAEKLMSELDKAGVVYQARISSNSGTTISVNIADKPRLDIINEALKKALNPEQPKAENKSPKHSR